MWLIRNVVRLIISLSNFQADLEVFSLTYTHPDCMFYNGLVNDADFSFFWSRDGIRQQFYAGTGELFTDNIVREIVRSPDKWSSVAHYFDFFSEFLVGLVLKTRPLTFYET